MGTNYYVKENHCECCKRYDTPLHIGKSSGGWSFSFHGYRELGLISWPAWKFYLFSTNATIVDEYGQDMPYAEFVEMIETVKAPGYMYKEGHQNLQHNEYGKKAPYKYFDAKHDWDDDLGYAFGDKEFS
jgi:hypothetical protein